MNILTKDFVEFIECCVARDVRFLIVGGYALAAHGHPRATKGLDVWIMIDQGNAERLVGALGDFGMDSVGLEPSDFLEPDVVVAHPQGTACWSDRIVGATSTLGPDLSLMDSDEQARRYPETRITDLDAHLRIRPLVERLLDADRADFGDDPVCV